MMAEAKSDVKKIELTEYKTIEDLKKVEDDIKKGWGHGGVLYNGIDVFKAYVGDKIQDELYEAAGFVGFTSDARRCDLDEDDDSTEYVSIDVDVSGQECYLGYNPKTGLFRYGAEGRITDDYYYHDNPTYGTADFKFLSETSIEIVSSDEARNKDGGTFYSHGGNNGMKEAEKDGFFHIRID